jgi:hypothetical protein
MSWNSMYFTLDTVLTMYTFTYAFLTCFLSTAYPSPNDILAQVLSLSFIAHSLTSAFSSPQKF